MNGFDRLKEQLKDEKDIALKQTIDYLISRKDMEQKYLNEEKTVDGMQQFIKGKGHKHFTNGWAYIPNEVVFSWAIMYFSLPNSILKITDTSKKSSKKQENNTNTSDKKDNIISLKDAKEKIEQKKENDQLSMFGGDEDE